MAREVARSRSRSRSRTPSTVRSSAHSTSAVGSSSAKRSRDRSSPPASPRSSAPAATSRTSRHSGLSGLDWFLFVSFLVFLLNAWVNEPYIVWKCGWEGLRECAEDWVARLWIWYAEGDPIFFNLPAWLRIMCALDTFFNAFYYLAMTLAIWHRKLHSRLVQLIGAAGSGWVIYSCIVYFLYEVVEEQGRAVMWWVFAVNAPWVIVPALLLYRLYRA